MQTIPIVEKVDLLLGFVSDDVVMLVCEIACRMDIFPYLISYSTISYSISYHIELSLPSPSAQNSFEQTCLKDRLKLLIDLWEEHLPLNSSFEKFALCNITQNHGNLQFPNNER